MRRHRSDKTAAAIVKALRQIGACVEYITQSGNGVPDLICGWRGRTILLEVKSPGGDLGDDQREWHALWRGGPTAVVRTKEEAFKAIGVGL